MFKIKVLNMRYVDMNLMQKIVYLIIFGIVLIFNIIPRAIFAWFRGGCELISLSNDSDYVSNQMAIERIQKIILIIGIIIGLCIGLLF